MEKKKRVLLVVLSPSLLLLRSVIAYTLFPLLNGLPSSHLFQTPSVLQCTIHGWPISCNILESPLRHLVALYFYLLFICSFFHSFIQYVCTPMSKTHQRTKNVHGGSYMSVVPTAALCSRDLHPAHDLHPLDSTRTAHTVAVNVGEPSLTSCFCYQVNSIWAFLLNFIKISVFFWVFPVWHF